MTQITLYEYAPSRSARCHWTLLEANLKFTSASDGPSLVGSEARQHSTLGSIGKF
ncbi:hypothetical protein [Sphingorhabdus sp. Alg231-15]|uniref:hypothetical protein n=1 Tax=Sphingorhabdus sp. Alg231-15 TaxID=1922222 RepID=UPI00307C1FCE